MITSKKVPLVERVKQIFHMYQIWSHGIKFAVYHSFGKLSTLPYRYKIPCPFTHYNFSLVYGTTKTTS